MMLVTRLGISHDAVSGIVSLMSTLTINLIIAMMIATSLMTLRGPLRI